MGRGYWPEGEDQRTYRTTAHGCGDRRRKSESRVFFFSSRRRHTRYWRDWSSDVCSSDLIAASSNSSPPPRTRRVDERRGEFSPTWPDNEPFDGATSAVLAIVAPAPAEGAVGDRKSVV